MDDYDLEKITDIRTFFALYQSNICVENNCTQPLTALTKNEKNVSDDLIKVENDNMELPLQLLSDERNVNTNNNDHNNILLLIDTDNNDNDVMNIDQLIKQETKNDKDNKSDKENDKENNKSVFTEKENESVFTFMSAKGANLLYIKGYIFHLKSISTVSQHSHWICVHATRRYTRCNARAVTCCNASENHIYVLRLTNEHCHPASHDDLLMRVRPFLNTSDPPKKLNNLPYVLSEISNRITSTGLKHMNYEDLYVRGAILQSVPQKRKETVDHYSSLLKKLHYSTRRSPIRLYIVSDGPPSLAVRMCAMVLDIPYILQHVDFMAGEHLTEQYAQINPQREIPVMDDNGFLLSESVAIMQYLCETYQSDSICWYPNDIKAKASVNHRLSFNLSSYYPCISSYVLAPIFYDYKRTELGLKRVHNALKILEIYLQQSTHNYVANTMTLTIADIALFCSTLCLEVIQFDLKPYVNVYKWYSDFKIQQPKLWNLADEVLKELKAFEANPPDLSHINHPLHPIRK